MFRIFVAGLLGDQQEGDKYTAKSCSCNCYQEPRNTYLPTDQFLSKTIKITRNKVQLAAEGEILPGTNKTAKWIVLWNPDKKNVRPGPA